MNLRETLIIAANLPPSPVAGPGEGTCICGAVLPLPALAVVALEVRDRTGNRWQPARPVLLCWDCGVLLTVAPRWCADVAGIRPPGTLREC